MRINITLYSANEIEEEFYVDKTSFLTIVIVAALSKKGKGWGKGR